MDQSSIYSMTDFIDMSTAVKVDGILLECMVREVLKKKVNEITDQGIPIVIILNDAPRMGRKSYVGTNPYQPGQEYAS